MDKYIFVFKIGFLVYILVSDANVKVSLKKIINSDKGLFIITNNLLPSLGRDYH